MENLKVNMASFENLKQMINQNFDKPVKAIVPQDSHNNIKIRIVGATIDPSKLGFTKKCKPRKKLDGKDNLFSSLPIGLIHSFESVNKKMVDWLAKSPENAKVFLDNPTHALTIAGVELQRADQKQIHRNFDATKEANLLSPGMEIKKFDAFFQTGKIKKVAESEKNKNKDNDCNCGCK
jgi:hypothetical protein